MVERCSIGIDVGHTNFRAARVVNGAPVKVLISPTDIPGGPAGVLEQARAAVAELGEDGVPIGVGIAGQCDTERGIVRCGPNLFWPDVPFGELLSEQTGCPVVLRNDVVMATFGEWSFGAGQGVNDLVCLFVGTGIGGGAIINGTLLEGSTGYGGHFGHLSVQMDGPRCTCGRHGCVEAYAGGGNVALRVRRDLLSDAKISPTLTALSKGRPESIDCRMVADAARAGDPYAMRVRNEMAEALSSAVASIINSLNPRKVVLGGSVLFGFPELYHLVVEGALSHCLMPALDRLTVDRSSLGDLAGVVGAAALAAGTFP
jgi:glucokinase